MPMSLFLVTGADGFIGSHLVEHLLASGRSVKALCAYNSTGSLGWLDTLEPSMKSQINIVLGDIRDPQFVRETVRGCDTVMHLAALIAIPYSYIAPQSYVDTNITGTLNVLQACRDLETSRLVLTSTSETYGSAQYVPIDESHPLVGQSPYAATKIAADQLALSYWLSFSTPLSILRPFNTYGPRQSARAVIPTIISQINSGSDTIKLGSLYPTRDFNFVSDTCAAFEAIATCDAALGKTVNACSSYEISIGDTVNLISELMGREISILSDDQRHRPPLSEVNRLLGDNSLLCSLTNWRPRYSGLDGFRLGLKKTIDWFSQPENIARYNPDIYSI